MKYLIMVIIVTAIFNCTRISEGEWIEQTKRPIIDVDTVIINQWGTIPEPPTSPDIGM